MPPAAAHRVSFGPYEADFQSGELRKHGRKIRLQAKSFEVLALLLERAGELVTREELRRRLWPANIAVEFENNLNTAVARLREALGDAPDKPRFIETLPRRGYRFVAEVLRAPVAAVRKLRIAVLPLENLSGDPGQEYFVDGVTEELITQLAAVAPARLGVIARTTAMRYRDARKDAARVGRELDLDYVVEGSVRRALDRVRISAQLVETSGQTHVWAQSYDVELRDILSLQSAVAQTIVRQINLTVSSITMPTAVDPQAFDAYVKGLHEFNKFTQSGLQKAAEHFSSAIAHDPGYANAYAKLALTWPNAALWGSVPSAKVMRQAEAAAAKALELDPTLAGAHAALGAVQWLCHWNFDAAQSELERAVELNPNDAASHWALALFLGSMREDHETAAREAILAAELDPLSSLIRANTAWLHYWTREYDRAIAQSRSALAIDEDCLQAYYVLGAAACVKGSFGEAIHAARAATLRSTDPLSLGLLGLISGLAGEREQACAVLRQMQERAVSEYVPAVCLAWIHLGLGDVQRALDWFERAYEHRESRVLWLRVAPTYDALRDDPRYYRLLERIGLPPVVSSPKSC